MHIYLTKGNKISSGSSMSLHSPSGTVPGGQVVFVTHSPFLIDKNRADRIRVLDKGSGEEGVRVVRDVGRNHFEAASNCLGGIRRRDSVYRKLQLNIGGIG